jgi:hypothetical protein
MRDSTWRSSSRFRARRLCEASSTSNCGRSYSANEMSRYIRMFSWESAHSEACCTHRRQLDHGRDGPTELRNAISFLREHSIAGGYRDEPDVRLDPQTEVDISFKLLVVILFGPTYPFGPARGPSPILLGDEGIDIRDDSTTERYNGIP